MMLLLLPLLLLSAVVAAVAVAVAEAVCCCCYFLASVQEAASIGASKVTVTRSPGAGTVLQGKHVNDISAEQRFERKVTAVLGLSCSDLISMPEPYIGLT